MFLISGFVLQICIFFSFFSAANSFYPEAANAIRPQQPDHTSHRVCEFLLPGGRQRHPSRAARPHQPLCLEPLPFPGLEPEGCLEPLPFPGLEPEGFLEPLPFTEFEPEGFLEPLPFTEFEPEGCLEPLPFPKLDPEGCLEPLPFQELKPEGCLEPLPFPELEPTGVHRLREVKIPPQATPEPAHNHVAQLLLVFFRDASGSATPPSTQADTTHVPEKPIVIHRFSRTASCPKAPSSSLCRLKKKTAVDPVKEKQEDAAPPYTQAVAHVHEIPRRAAPDDAQTTPRPSRVNG